MNILIWVIYSKLLAIETAISTRNRFVHSAKSMQNLCFIDLLKTFCYKCVHCFTIDLNQQFDICRYCFLLWLFIAFSASVRKHYFLPFFLSFLFLFCASVRILIRRFFFFICFVWRNIFCTSHHNLFNSFVFRFHVILFTYLFFIFVYSSHVIVSRH